jgi:hypothetical protein
MERPLRRLATPMNSVMAIFATDRSSGCHSGFVIIMGSGPFRHRRMRREWTRGVCRHKCRSTGILAGDLAMRDRLR